MGRYGPLHNLDRSFPALFPNLWNVASKWAFLVFSKVFTQVSNSLFAVCHSERVVGESLMYISRCAWCKRELASLYLVRVLRLKEVAYDMIRPLKKALPASQNRLGLCMCGALLEEYSAHASEM